MPGNCHDKVNHLKRRMDQCIRKSGFDENFMEACKFHLDKVLLQFEPSRIRSREEYINVLMSNLFIENMDLFPAKRFKSQINECTPGAWPLPLLPSEVFAENAIPAESRKFVFYQCLRVGDYLECRVTSSDPSSAEYQLRVIHKYGVTRILDDLNIVVTMRKADIKDLPQILREFENYQLVRVVVIEKEKEENETKVYVSVKDNTSDIRAFSPPLGVIPDTNVPKYVLNPYHSDRATSFKDYLTSNRGFYDPVLLNGVYEGFGINPRGIYTYFPINESFNAMDAKVLLKESKLSDANDYMVIALRDHALKDFSYALAAINLAIKCYPPAVTKNDKVELGKLYEIKGDIQGAQIKPKMSLNGCKDWLTALNLDRTNESVKSNLSREMSRVAMKYYKKKVYNSAAEWASKALKLNDKNVEAQVLMEHLKKKHPEATDDWDEESIQALLEKHKAIGSELKKLSGEASVPIVPYFDSSTSSSPSSSTV